MKALHLFAGAGGSVLAGRLLGWESVGAVELDPYCCAVLEARGERVLARDITAFDARPLRGQVDVVVGGWPRRGGYCATDEAAPPACGHARGDVRGVPADLADAGGGA